MLAAYKGVWGRAQVVHLLKRSTFGAKPADVEYFVKKGLEATVAELFQRQPAPKPPVNDYQNDYKDTLGIDVGTTWINSQYGDGTLNYFRRRAFKTWWVNQMLMQGRSIEEKMILFWHNHFVASVEIIDDARMSYQYQEVLRKYSLGNFKELAKAVTTDPGMLIYLNGYKNGKNSPDENYARELQELFTVGKGPESKYVEADVRTAARVLTGYRVDYQSASSNFDLSQHDTGDKQFSAFYNNTIIKGGNTSISGRNELNDLLDMIYAKEEVSKFLCRKFYRFFVADSIDDKIEAEIIEPLAKLLRESAFEVLPVLNVLLKSEHFYSADVRGAIIKSPIELFVGTLQALSVELPPVSDVIKYAGVVRYLLENAAEIQQELGNPPNVAGWSAYYQTPSFYRAWLNTVTLPKRVAFTDYLCQGRTGFDRNKFAANFPKFIASLPNPADPNQLIKDSVAYLLSVELSAELMEELKKNFLLSGQTSDYYWTDAWNDFKVNPSLNNDTVPTRLKALYQYLLGLPEYQLM